MMTTIALPEPTTSDNAERACHWFRLVQEHGRMTLEAAANLGDVLIEQRDLCRQERKRGGSTFSGWVAENLPFSRASAANYMAIAEHWPELVNALTSCDRPPSIREAVKRIAEIKAERDPSPSLTDGIAPEPDGNSSRAIRNLREVSGERFACIYADPPWQYANQATRAATDNHYPTMTVAEIAELPIAELATDNAQLHLWTTNGFLPGALEVMGAWGFGYRSMFVWCKPQMGLGNYWRVSHELLLCGVRGSATFRDQSLKSWGEFDRGRHSAKPGEVRAMIERACPGPYLELFGRQEQPGWTVFGNQVERNLLVAMEAGDSLAGADAAT